MYQVLAGQELCLVANCIISQKLIHKWNFVLCLKIQNRPPKEVDGWRKGILDKGDSKYKFLGV